MSGQIGVKLPNGRIISNGRKAALSALDCLLEQQQNIQLLYDAMQSRLVENPMAFFEQFVMPLIPNSMKDDDATTSSPESKAAAIRDALEAANKATAALEADLKAQDA